MKLFEGLKNKNATHEENELLMKGIRSVQSMRARENNLEKQRSEMDFFAMLAAAPIDVKSELFSVGSISCELTRPAGAHSEKKIILYCHGGGYTCGGLGYARILASKLAAHTALEVVSFEYSLAPEHPFPAAINDAKAVWNHLMLKGHGADDIILCGDSAGGNLALELCLSLKEENRMLPAALVLMSPWTDMRANSQSYVNCKEKDPMLSYEYIISVREAYVGNDDYSKPCYSPLLADLSGLPPMLVQVGSHEILRSDSESLAKKAIRQGVLCRLQVYKNCWHVFQQMPIAAAGKALDAVREFIQEIS